MTSRSRGTASGRCWSQPPAPAGLPRVTSCGPSCPERRRGGPRSSRRSARRWPPRRRRRRSRRRGRARRGRRRRPSCRCGGRCRARWGPVRLPPRPRRRQGCGRALRATGPAGAAGRRRSAQRLAAAAAAVPCKTAAAGVDPRARADGPQTTRRTMGESNAPSRTRWCSTPTSRCSTLQSLWTNRRTRGWPRLSAGYSGATAS